MKFDETLLETNRCISWEIVTKFDFEYRTFHVTEDFLRGLIHNP